MRTDIHRPSQINPECYMYICMGYTKVEGLGDAIFLQEERKVLRKHMSRSNGQYSKHEHGGTCYICGNANCLYYTVWYHEETNSYLKIGFTCTEKMDFGSPELFRKFTSFKNQIKAMKHNKAGRIKAKGLLEERELHSAWNWYTTPVDENEYTSERYRKIKIIHDLVDKLVRYGELSDKQWEFLMSLTLQVKMWETYVKNREVERAKVPDVPEGRMQVIAKIVSSKTDPIYGKINILIEHQDGFRLWGSRPKGIVEEKGSKIQFTATLIRSAKDSKFGFFKNPRKAMTIRSA